MSELSDFYDRYIAAFNAGDAAAFVGFFHLPVTIVPSAPDGRMPVGKQLPALTRHEQLCGMFPKNGAYSTVDALVTLDEVAPPLSDARPGIIATVTRRHADGAPFARLQALYLLTREGGPLGIKVMAQLSFQQLGEPPR